MTKQLDRNQTIKLTTSLWILGTSILVVLRWDFDGKIQNNVCWFSSTCHRSVTQVGLFCKKRQNHCITELESTYFLMGLPKSVPMSVLKLCRLSQLLHFYLKIDLICWACCRTPALRILLSQMHNFSETSCLSLSCGCNWVDPLKSYKHDDTIGGLGSLKRKWVTWMLTYQERIKW